jgi:hypothetical protein
MRVLGRRGRHLQMTRAGKGGPSAQALPQGIPSARPFPARDPPSDRRPTHHPTSARPALPTGAPSASPAKHVTARAHSTDRPTPSHVIDPPRRATTRPTHRYRPASATRAAPVRATGPRGAHTRSGPLFHRATSGAQTRLTGSDHSSTAPGLARETPPARSGRSPTAHDQAHERARTIQAAPSPSSTASRPGERRARRAPYDPGPPPSAGQARGRRKRHTHTIPALPPSAGQARKTPHTTPAPPARRGAHHAIGPTAHPRGRETRPTLPGPLPHGTRSGA